MNPQVFKVYSSKCSKFQSSTQYQIVFVYSMFLYMVDYWVCHITTCYIDMIFDMDEVQPQLLSMSEMAELSACRW